MTWYHAEVSTILYAAPRRSTALPHRCSSCAAWGRGRIAQSRGSGSATRRSGGEADPVTGLRKRRTTGSAGLSPSHIRRQRSHFAQIHRRRPSPARIQRRSPSLTRPRRRLLLVRPFVAPISCTSYDNGHRRLHLRSHRRWGGNCVAIPSYSCGGRPPPPCISFLYKFPLGWASISLPPVLHLIFP